MKSLTLLFMFLLLGAFCAPESRAQDREFIKEAQTRWKKRPYDGGSPNQVAQLDHCKELKLVPFSELGKVNKAAFALLKNTHGNEAEKAYNKASIYDNAVLLNTAAAAASVGADFSGAVILKPYYSEKSSVNTGFQQLPFGYYFKGFTGIPKQPPSGRNSMPDRYRDMGSVEVKTDENGDTHFDVDLYNPQSDYRAEHWEEVLFNEAHQRPTHPGDVIKQLYKDRKLKTGVSCKN